MESLEKELNQDIYSSDNAINNTIAKKQQRPLNRYSSTKVKARNFLTNVSYNRIKDSDYQNKSFVIDCFSFILLYLNPFYLERKFETIIERDYVNLIWSYMMPETLYNFICMEDNYKTLNKLKLKFHETNEIIKIFLENDSTYFDVLKDYLIKNARSYQFVYGNLFPRYFARIDDCGIQSKTNFNNFYKNYVNHKNVFEWRQNSILPTIPDIEGDVSTLLNLTELNDENVNFEKLNQIQEKVEEAKLDDISKKNKKEKNAEKKKKKREEKKRKLEEKLDENTKKIKKKKKQKIKKT